MDGNWAQAEEPLHWLVDSPDPVHSGDLPLAPSVRRRQHKNRTKGAGLGLAVRRRHGRRNGRSGRPGRLRPRRHQHGTVGPGQERARGARASTARCSARCKAGGKVTGVLWYQGESDAKPGPPEGLSQGLRRLHRGCPVRSRPARAAVLLRPDRPVHPRRRSQGLEHRAGRPAALPERVPNTAVVSVIDLELDDGIHVGTQGLKRAGQRLARIAQRELFGQVGATTPPSTGSASGPTTRWSSSSRA